MEQHLIKLIGRQVIARFEQPVLCSPYDHQIDGILEQVDTCNQTMLIGGMLINMRHAVLLSVMEMGNPKAVGVGALMEMKAYLKEMMSPLVDADAMPTFVERLLDMLHRAEEQGQGQSQQAPPIGITDPALDEAMHDPFFRAGWHAYSAASVAGLHVSIVPQYAMPEWQHEWSRGYVWYRDGADNYLALDTHLRFVKSPLETFPEQEAAHVNSPLSQVSDGNAHRKSATYVTVPSFEHVQVGDRVWGKNDAGLRIKGIGEVVKKYPGTCEVSFGDMRQHFAHGDYGTKWGASRHQHAPIETDPEPVQESPTRVIVTNYEDIQTDDIVRFQEGGEDAVFWEGKVIEWQHELCTVDRERFGCWSVTRTSFGVSWTVTRNTTPSPQTEHETK